MFIFKLLLLLIILSLEHVGYALILHDPNLILTHVNNPNEAIDLIEQFSISQKIIQLTAIVLFMYNFYRLNQLQFSDQIKYSLLISGVILCVLGRFLDISVFKTIGRNGVYYGKRFGLAIPWVNTFPYGNKHIKHPQYIGATSIWIGACLIVYAFISDTSILVQNSIISIAIFQIMNYYIMAKIEEEDERLRPQRSLAGRA